MHVLQARYSAQASTTLFQENFNSTGFLTLNFQHLVECMASASYYSGPARRVLGIWYLDCILTRCVVFSQIKYGYKVFCFFLNS